MDAAWRGLTSLRLTIACLSLLMALVVLCTLAQVQLGTFGAVDVYIRSFFVYWRPAGASWSVPLFPGGATVGLLLAVNLAVVQAVRMERSRRKAGLWIVHFGLLLLFLGEFVTGAFQVESQMAIPEGGTTHYSENLRETELVVIETTRADYDEVYSIPRALYAGREPIEHSRLPFALLVKKHFANSAVERRQPGEAGPSSLATAGLGPQLVALERPRVSRDDEEDLPTVFVELIDGDRSLGTWLLSSALGVEQPLTHAGRSFVLALRRKRHYVPFSLTLKDFRHEKYPGTEIPSHFSSLVRLRDPRSGADRDVLISMNEPLRYGGRTFYQASFGQGDTLSVLQVVRNPGWALPYVACVLVALGLLAHFVIRLAPMWRRA